MMRNLVVIFAFLVCCVSAENVTNINFETDELLLYYNKALTSAGFGMYLLEEQMKLGSGVILGLNTLVRTGDCFQTDKPDGSLTFDYQLGFGTFLLGYGEFYVDGENEPSFLQVKKTGLRVSYTVYRPRRENCYVSVTKLELNQFDQMILHSPNSKHDGMDVSSYFGAKVRDKLNQRLNSLKNIYWSKLVKNYCYEIDFLSMH